MKTVSAASAESNFYNLIDSVLSDQMPIQITGKCGNAILVAESDWLALQETLHLSMIPGMLDSIREGIASAPEDCETDIDL